MNQEKIEKRRKYQREWKRKNYDRFKEKVRKAQQKNRAAYLKKAILRSRENKQKAVEYLGNQCKRCEGKFPLEVYDFHHRNPIQKDFGIAYIKGRKFENMKEELNKCDLLCANCHRVRHAEIDNDYLEEQISEAETETYSE